MGQQVNVYRKLKMWPGAIVEGLAPIGVGTTFYVDMVNGSSGNDGLSPTYPKAKISQALALCTAEKDDYVYVISKGTSTYVEGAVINMTTSMNRTHLIGVGTGPNAYCQLKSASDFNCIYVTGYTCEIANFRLAGGSTSSGIMAHNATQLYVHHCDFGNKDAATTPLYGFFADGIDAYEMVEDNVFSGNGGTTSAGTITSNGVYTTGAFRASIVRHNLFSQLPDCAIAMSGADGAFIVDNYIMADASADTAAGISLSNCGGCLVHNNCCNYGKSTNTTKFFVDNGTTNGWGWNTVNGVLLQC